MNIATLLAHPTPRYSSSVTYATIYTYGLRVSLMSKTFRILRKSETVDTWKQVAHSVTCVCVHKCCSTLDKSIFDASRTSMRWANQLPDCEVEECPVRYAVASRWQRIWVFDPPLKGWCLSLKSWTTNRTQTQWLVCDCKRLKTPLRH